MAPHPFDQLSLEETQRARDLILKLHPNTAIFFRYIFLEEAPKGEIKKYLEAEHAGKDPEPLNRRAMVLYDVIDSDKIPVYNESVVDVTSGKRLDHKVVGKEFHASLTVPEFRQLVQAVEKSDMFKKCLEEYQLPEGYELVVEPWPYGGLLPGEENSRYFQGLCFAQDTRSNNPDSNFYSFPLPFIPVMDASTQEIVRVDRLATGGKGDPMEPESHPRNPVDHCTPSEYVPELLPNGPRKDLKPLDVVQPEGPSFKITNDSLVEWQGWRFRVSFNPREGAVLHDLHFNGRSVMYRLSFSEMTVPYADARYPFARKQAFDFGDGGAGTCANNLSLGCDCLGVIKYFDSVVTDAEGKPEVASNVVCLHEQDNGIAWKHTNWRTGRAVVARNRELVVQFIITLANYEYVFAYKLDTMGGINVETRATGIVSVVNIDPGKQSDYGTVVSEGALAQNHQHIFCIRIDPAIDGHNNTAVIEESHPVAMNDKTNPRGNYYEVIKTPIKNSRWLDADIASNRVVKIQNTSKTNPISGRPVGYKFAPMATQLLLADKNSVQAQRALFAQHHVWVTKHQDGELYAAGRYTLQSTREEGGLADMVARNDNTENEDIVVWATFGLTHNPRVEDWPVMPVEIHELKIRPADFWHENPAIDLPTNKNQASRLANGDSCCSTNGADGANGHHVA
ncbi:hypothetical protein LTR70_000082 [Exophiala xenobiotica]|uniref:Amine oxidase n=1 Tax=Lithohypha guttulata TaxID=1690604 RepID=A0ABR0KP17_9EURO|nr:hypothetical protein LTR24_000207 [Lithohypha guttulata]KAK5330760.1 hypothetical protein LTR70_000082 [Exophiala xenobiotica]